MCVRSGKGGVEALQHSHDVLALAYRPDGKLLASATLDGQIYLWDPQEAQLLVSLHAMLLHHPACLGVAATVRKCIACQKRCRKPLKPVLTAHTERGQMLAGATFLGFASAQ